jgi:hypothetical protein
MSRDQDQREAFMRETAKILLKDGEAAAEDFVMANDVPLYSAVDFVREVEEMLERDPDFSKSGS